MTVHLIDPVVSTLAVLLLKATIVLGLTALALAVLGRWMSASVRHLVTTLASVMLLTLPALSLVAPAWPLPGFVPASAAVPSDAADWRADDGRAIERSAALLDHAAAGRPSPAGAPDEWSATPTAPTGAPVARLPWASVLLAIYALGVCLMAVQLAVQRWRVGRLRRDAREVTDPAWLALLGEGSRVLGVGRRVRLLRSRGATMPMTFGTRRPAILLPATADTWDDDRRRAVVLHELAHVARWDCLTQWCACVVRALYWCHPGAWWLVSRVRLDREFACDDLVLAAGAQPHEYARHLLDIAYSFGGGRAPALAVRMARRSQIEARLRALLDPSRTRRSPSRPARLATTASAFAVLLPLASATVPTQQAPAPGSGAEPRPAVRLTSRDESQVRAVPSPRTSARAAPAPALVTVGPALRPVRRSLGEGGARLASAADLQQGGSTASGACTWEVGPGSGDTLHLSMRDGRSQTGRNVPAGQLDGLTAAQLSAGGPVRFVVRRDAGTFSFEGTARGGVAAGVCSFAPSPTFGAELAKRGITGLTPDDQLQLARHDVGLAFVDELRTQKYATPSVADLVKTGQHGVHLAYLRGMGALGYSTGTLAPLITLRDHGVTPEYAQALAALGYAKLPVDQIQKARDHGVTPEYVKGMRDAGHGTLTLEQLIRTRDHGVTPEFGQALAAAGYANVPLDQLVRTRDHGVTAAYIRDMKALGIAGSLEDLVRARDHGVVPAFVKDVQGVGYTGLSIDDLVTLRDHGLTASRIQQLNTRAGARLTVAGLRDAASGRTR